MKRFRLSGLRDINEEHVLRGFLPGKSIISGGLSFEKPDTRTHTNDGPEGIDFHVHEDCEAFIIMQGRGFVEIDKTLYSLTTGDIIIVEPGEDHHLISDSEKPLITLWCMSGD